MLRSSLFGSAFPSSLRLSIITSRQIASTAATLGRQHKVVRVAPKTRRLALVNTYSEEFAENRAVAQHWKQQPWVPKKELQAQRQRHRLNERLRRQKVELERQKGEVHKVHLASTSASKSTSASASTSASSRTSADTPTTSTHPSPMVEYHQRVAHMRVVYAEELRIAEEKRVDEERASATLARANQQKDLAEHAEERRAAIEKASISDQTQSLLMAMDDYFTREVKRGKRISLESQVTLEKQEHLLRLYRASGSFVTAENLENRLDEFLGRQTDLQSLPLKAMQCLAALKTERAREHELYDVLNDTLEKQETVGQVKEQVSKWEQVARDGHAVGETDGDPVLPGSSDEKINMLSA